MSTRSTRTPGTTKRSPVQLAALAVGAVFLLVGILGFIPGITTDYDTMSFASHHSEAKLLGIFNVSILHNLVHVAFGVAGIVLARAAATAWCATSSTARPTCCVPATPSPSAPSRCTTRWRRACSRPGSR